MSSTTTRCHSEGVGDANDALEYRGLTTTRRTWAMQRNDAMKQVVVGDDSIIDQQASGGLTLTTATTTTTATFSTPSHSTVMWVSPVTPNVQQERATSIDLVWCGESETVNGATPPTVLTRLPRRAEYSEIPLSATVRRRLSLQDGGRKSGTVASTRSSALLQETPSPAYARTVLATPSPLGHVQRLLQAADPPTESRDVPLRPGCTLPSPTTPLWSTLDAGDDEEQEENSYHDDVVVRLTLGRRPSSFRQGACGSISMAPLTNSAENGQPCEMNSPPAVLAAAAASSATPRSQRQVEMERRKKWEEEMQNFFKQIDQRSLLTVNVDDMQRTHK